MDLESIMRLFKKQIYCYLNVMLILLIILGHYREIWHTALIHFNCKTTTVSSISPVNMNDHMEATTTRPYLTNVSTSAIDWSCCQTLVPYSSGLDMSNTDRQVNTKLIGSDCATGWVLILYMYGDANTPLSPGWHHQTMTAREKDQEDGCNGDGKKRGSQKEKNGNGKKKKYK